LPRDTSKQIESGTLVNIKETKACDLVFFSNIDSEKVSHVGLLLDKSKIVHSSGKVRIDNFTSEGIVQDGKLIYKTISIRRIL
jgi:cell wall-associated NlpC family hydrolase